MVLVISELINGQMRKISYEMTSAAKEISQSIGGSADVLVLGSQASSFTDELKKYGADNVLVAKDEKFDQYAIDSYLATILPLVESANYKYIFLAASLQGKDLAAALAGKLEAGLAMDVIEYKIEGSEVHFKRPIYSGKAYANVKILSVPAIATVRPNNFDLKELNGEGNVKDVAPNIVDDRVEVVERILEKSDRIDAREASIVVSGGRGMKNAENFKIIEELADILGAGVGASRAATDAGWRPHSDQVGQTGKVVSPNLYIACGISGAIQHMAGCGSSKYIVAVNKDPDAPIFQVATYGIVHDLHEFVPIFTAEVKKLLGK